MVTYLITGSIGKDNEVGHYVIAWEDMSIVEVGSGIGTCAVVGGMMGARYMATDADDTFGWVVF